MSSKENLKIVVHEADALISDTSVFAVLGINNPVDKVYDKIPGKGYYLTALGTLTALGFYSRIYFSLITKTPKQLTLEQTQSITKIEKLIKSTKLGSYYISKKPGSILSSDEDFFESFMKELKDKGLDLGLKHNEFRIAWKQIRNMISHLSFPLGPVGGKHVESANQEAIKQLGLPIYDLEKVMEIMRKGMYPSEAFNLKNNVLTVNSTVLLAYIYPIRDYLIEIIDNSDEARCKYALATIQEVIDRQKIKISK